MNAIVIVLSIVVIFLLIRVGRIEKQSKKDRTEFDEKFYDLGIELKAIDSVIKDIGFGRRYRSLDNYRDCNHIPIKDHASRILEIENYLGIEWHEEQRVPAGYKKIEEPKPEENK